MPDPKQLQHLMKLLDDESSVVREQVFKELSSYGPSLEEELLRQHIDIRPEFKELLHSLLKHTDRIWLDEQWQGWPTLRDDKLRLETALHLLSQFIAGRKHQESLPLLLDEIATTFRSSHLHITMRQVAGYLFKDYALKGVETAEYYHPENSDLISVLKNKTGLPISLVCIFILVGNRLGLEIEGCNVPGHFMATAIDNGKKVIVDCFHGGIILDETTLQSLNMSVPITIKDLLTLECNTEEIIARVIRNLIHAYQQNNDKATVEFLGKLLRNMEKHG